ncbi:MAG TPA: hypothetical protein VN732_08625 [Solirubrobacterales bacterium]|nr:hypothetical protein [Solirubrobacterales bacterium]
MSQGNWKPGTLLRRSLPDGFTYYARLLEAPFAAFYAERTPEPVEDPRQIVEAPVLFTVPVHKSLLGEGGWEPVAALPADPSLRPPLLFRQDILEPSSCTIVDPEGNEREATPEECEGLEAEAVWEPEHVDDRLMDHFAGRPNPWLADLELRRPSR